MFIQFIFFFHSNDLNNICLHVYDILKCIIILWIYHHRSAIYLQNKQYAAKCFVSFREGSTIGVPHIYQEKICNQVTSIRELRIIQRRFNYRSVTYLYNKNMQPSYLFQRLRIINMVINMKAEPVQNYELCISLH